MEDFFHNIFPKLKPLRFKDKCAVLEHESNADVREVVWNNLDGLYFDHELAKKLTSIFEKFESPELFRKDCDGILIFEKDGRKYIFLTELKSGFGTERTYKAKRQLIASYIKLNMILSLGSFYKPEEYIVKYFIFGYPPKAEFLSSRLQSLSMMPRGHARFEEYQFSRRLFFPLTSQSFHNYKAKVEEIECIRDLGLNNKIFSNPLDFYFIEVPEGSRSITLDVNVFL